MTLVGCAAAPPIVPQVLVAPPTTPRAEFFIEKVQVQSRETGALARERNETYARELSGQIRVALQDAEKALAPPPADSIRPKLFLAYEAVSSTAQGGRRAEAYVEVRLELVDAAGAVLYVTHTRAAIKRGDDADALIRDALQKAARDFASRL